MKLSQLAKAMCTLTALPDIFYREKQAEEAKTKPAPKRPELKAGQTAKYDPLHQAWRIYTPKQPKYRVVFDTEEMVYLERRYQNALITEAYNDLRVMKLEDRGEASAKRIQRYVARARVARAEADACARTINELKGAV